MSKDAPKVISLFAGCGGSSLGYKLAGCKVLAAVEFDKNAAAVYRENFPDTRLHETDIATLNPLELLKELGLEPGKLDILDGSPPCQGFSMAGKRRMDDPRNRLFEEYVRFLKAIRPKAFVMENVPGLVTGKMRAIFHEMVKALTEAGYEVRGRVLNAAHYGVPQNRKRVILIGFRTDLELTPEHPAPSSFPITFRQAIADLSDHEMMLAPKGKALASAKAIRSGESGADFHRRYRQKGNEFSLIRLSWDAPCPTVLKTLRPGQVGLLHPDENRFLSIGELKRVCSFPDDFVLQGSFIDRWGRLGNAVPPLLTKAVAESIARQLKSG
jgi:DNA (cytosine-5)-methyltransferase 1